MSQLSLQILQAVQGDPDAIRSLAGAVARGDADAVHAILVARGIDIDRAQLGAVMAHAEAGATITYTYT